MTKTEETEGIVFFLNIYWSGQPDAFHTWKRQIFFYVRQYFIILRFKIFQAFSFEGKDTSGIEYCHVSNDWCKEEFDVIIV